MSDIYQVVRMVSVEPEKEFSFMADEYYQVFKLVGVDSREIVYGDSTAARLGAGFADKVGKLGEVGYEAIKVSNHIIFSFDTNLETLTWEQSRKDNLHIVTYRADMQGLAKGEREKFLRAYVDRRNELTSPEHMEESAQPSSETD